MRISQSRESKEQLIAKQLSLAAALRISLLLGASSARAQADTTMPPANITILSNLGPSNTDLYQAAVGVFGGTNQFLLALLNDDNGIPGTALATVTVTDAPPANTCCKLATANLGTPGIGLNSSGWALRRVWSHALRKDESGHRLTE